MANKVTHIINCAGTQIQNHWEPIGVAYLKFFWLDQDNQVSPIHILSSLLPMLIQSLSILIVKQEIEIEIKSVTYEILIFLYISDSCFLIRRMKHQMLYLNLLRRRWRPLSRCWSTPSEARVELPALWLPIS